MKLMEVVDGQGRRLGWMIFCPACDNGHFFDGRWSFNGDVERPTFSPSMLSNGRAEVINPAVPRCHSFVTDGKIRFLDDCSHALAGQTVDLPDWR